MNEQSIIDKLILHGINYGRFGDKRDKQLFANWMYKLQHYKNFSTLDEACNYFIAKGEEGVKLSA